MIRVRFSSLAPRLGSSVVEQMPEELRVSGSIPFLGAIFWSIMMITVIQVNGATLSISVLLYIMFAHFIADFVLQTHQMATNKSSSNYWLSMHVGLYTILMTVSMSALINDHRLVIWVLFNGIAHWITDYFTSRGSSHFFKKQDWHNGFVVVGIDQYMHLACLVLSTWYLSNRWYCI